MNLLHNNYIHWSGNGPTWKVSFDSASRPVKSFYQETVNVAEMIWAEKRGDIHLCFSGGLDSEYVLAVFQSIGMKIKPVIMQTQYNQHDTDYAYKFCKERNIDPIIIDLDFDKFVDSGKFLEIATNNKIAAYQMPANLWLTTQIDGTVITGDSDPHLFVNENKKWFLDEIEPIYSQFKYYTDNNIYGTPFFLSYTIENMLSFLVDPTIQLLANNGILGKTGTYSSKVHVYNNQDKFKLEQRQKQHGYEVVEKSPIFTHPDIQLVNSWKEKWWGSSNHEYFDLIERLSWTK